MDLEDEVYGIVSSLTGTESDQLRALCSVALAELTGRLRPDTSQEDCGDALIQAAAVQAAKALNCERMVLAAPAAVDSTGGEAHH